MKAVVEWGKTKQACQGRPCGVSGQMVMANPAQARTLAGQLFFTLTEGKESVPNHKEVWGVTDMEPRKVAWSADRTVWVCVSLLDGVPRGAFAALADKESLVRPS